MSAFTKRLTSQEPFSKDINTDIKNMDLMDWLKGLQDHMIHNTNRKVEIYRITFIRRLHNIFHYIQIKSSSSIIIWNSVFWEIVCRLVCRQYLVFALPPAFLYCIKFWTANGKIFQSDSISICIKIFLVILERCGIALSTNIIHLPNLFCTCFR